MSAPADPDEALADADEPLETLLDRTPAELGEAGESPERAARSREILALYLQEIARVKLLPPEQARELARRAQSGDSQAERQLVEANLRLVVRLARRYLGRGLSLLDLIEEGNVGLLQAVRKFQPDRGTLFVGYAAWWIRQAIVRALANQARMIRLPVHVELLLAQYARKRRELAQQLGHPPSVEELAAALGRPAAEVEQLESLRQRPVSLDSPPPATGRGSLSDRIEDPSSAPTAGLGALLRGRADLHGVLADLPDNERTVLTLRFGLGGEEPITLEDVGRHLGISGERVRRIEGAALRRLRRLLAARGIGPSDLLEG